jgi:hypothetical protein
MSNKRNLMLGVIYINPRVKLDCPKRNLMLGVCKMLVSKLGFYKMFTC